MEVGAYSWDLCVVNYLLLIILAGLGFISQTNSVCAVCTGYVCTLSAWIISVDVPLLLLRFSNGVMPIKLKDRW